MAPPPVLDLLYTYTRVTCPMPGAQTVVYCRAGVLLPRVNCASLIQVTMDEVPKDWLPPYEGEGTGSSLFRPESAKRAASKPALHPKRQGMQQVVSSRRAG